jgi:PAS domain S-box-containing protein
VSAEPLILNVDDYDANRYVRSGLLRKAGYRVEEARNGREALELIGKRRPDLVVLDVQMPEIDGLEVCRRVRADPSLASTLILHVSATATGTNSVVLGLDNGADGYLTDVAEPEVLLATVRALLRLRQAEIERNEARAQLAESEGRLSRLVNNLTDVVYRVRLKPDFAFEYVSPAATVLTGYLPEEFYADPEIGWKLVHPDDLGAVEGLSHARADQVAITARCLSRDGRTIWTEHRLAAIRDANGEIVAIEAVARDVTGQRTVEEELRRANQLKDEFLATLSHELRTPLNAIVGWSQMLQGGKLTSDLTERAVEAIARNAMSQRQLINDVLDVSRIITGKMRIEPRVFDLTSALRTAVEAFRPAAAAKGLAVTLTLPPIGLPMMGDPDRLQQVFWNLLSNAVKFTPEGGRIEVRARAAGHSIEIEVSDTGSGIPPWFLPQVFERFSQMDSSMSRRHHGLGLGLALVRHLVELHGGTVAAVSPGEGQGTTVKVMLPVRLEQAGPRAVMEGSDRVAQGQNAPLSGLSVLLVDDESDSRQVVGTVLRHAGADVSEAASARTALSMLPLLLPDILISDIGMPEQYGLELMRLVRTLPGNAGGSVRAIALTAYGRDEDRVKAIEAGYQLHLAKPIMPEELTEQVARLAADSRGANTRP